MSFIAGFSLTTIICCSFSSPCLLHPEVIEIPQLVFPETFTHLDSDGVTACWERAARRLKSSISISSAERSGAAGGDARLQKLVLRRCIEVSPPPTVTASLTQTKRFKAHFKGGAKVVVMRVHPSSSGVSRWCRRPSSCMCISEKSVCKHGLFLSDLCCRIGCFQDRNAKTNQLGLMLFVCFYVWAENMLQKPKRGLFSVGDLQITALHRGSAHFLIYISSSIHPSFFSPLLLLKSVCPCPITSPIFAPSTSLISVCLFSLPSPSIHWFAWWRC